MRGFAYDAAGQLTGETNLPSSGSNANSISYAYDNAGNRLTKTTNSERQDYTYDAANKLLNVTYSAGVQTTYAGYTYDGAGNVTRVGMPYTVIDYTWDGASRLTSRTRNFSGETFTYNGLGQQVGKTSGFGNTSVAYTLADDSIDSNVLADGGASYQYGLGLVSEVRGGASRVYHADSLGTTRTMSDASGAVSSSLETDAFGSTIAATGTGTPFGFAGQHGYQSDGDSGLMRLGYRYYDASVGRFLSRDPIHAGYNWYVYCENNPVNCIDPDGLDVEVVRIGPAWWPSHYYVRWPNPKNKIDGGYDSVGFWPAKGRGETIEVLVPGKGDIQSPDGHAGSGEVVYRITDPRAEKKMPDIVRDWQKANPRYAFIGDNCLWFTDQVVNRIVIELWWEDNANFYSDFFSEVGNLIKGSNGGAKAY